MKILVTGTNNYHCVPNWHLATRSRYRLVTGTTGLVNALKFMGHDVDQRYVTPGEDLSKYDKIFATYFDVLGGMQPGGYGVWWTLQQRQDAIVVIDDWATPGRLYKHYQKQLTEDELEHVLFRDFLVGSQRTESQFVIYDNQLKQKLKEGFLENIFDIRDILYCGFNNFNVDKIFNKQKHRSHFFNPEAHVPSPEDRLNEMGLLDPKSKRRRNWVIAGIGGLPTKKACKFKDIFTWPVEVYGRNTIDPDAVLAKEPEIINAYRNSRAVFYPDQGNFGSNWWRNRPRQCADMGAVLFMQSNEEASLFGPSYMNLSIEKIEAMTDQELDDLAAAQKVDYYKSNPLCKLDVHKKLNDLLY